jgi:NAD(P)-dependent dehydrogenase (short-subunit alcohol dehydrogenase family)
VTSQKTAIITGGTKGIGAAVARAFAEAEYTVIIAARTDNGLAKLLGPSVRFVAADVRRREDHDRLVQTAINGTGRIDVYVNGAGISQWRPVAEVDEAFWRTLIETNLTGTFWGCQAASKAMSSGSSIINISSLAGKRGSANNSVYCASKFGVNGITQALAKELGPRSIRVNAVCPVYVETETILQSLKDPRSPAGGRDVQSYLKDFAESNAALQRLPIAEEVAQSCLFLASSAASAITGQCINVDCGVLPQ